MQYPQYEVQQHLTPEEYLSKFKTPHSVINSAPSGSMKEDIEILQKILDIGYNDTEQTKALKEKALTQLKACVKKWLLKINPNVSQRCGLEIFGSYRMGVNSRDSDIDAVCIVPVYVDRQTHFFGDFVAQLSTNPNITQLFPIPTALIPLIKLKLYGVQFDILMSQIPDRILDTNFQFDNEILDLIDERERKNINGCRMASYLEKNVSNMEVFKIALKAIKMWARNKGVYLQMFSYLGGIGYTILLAKMVELYPNYSPLKILSRFFYIYSKWAWQIPVLLQESPNTENQKSEMTIMTPINPNMNTSHSVSKTTLRIMRKQFKEAYKTIEEIQKGSKTWNSLFTPFNILKKHRHFLEISIMANKKNDHIMWKGHIESKFRKLIKLLQGNNQYGNMIEVHPFPKEFISKHPSYKFCSRYYIGIKYKSYNIEDDAKEIDFTPHIRMFLQIIEIYEDINKLPEHINIGVSRVSAQAVGVQINKNANTFYKHQ